MPTLRGQIEKIVFSAPDTGFTVARLKELGGNEEKTVVGILPSLKEGESIVAEGQWQENSSYGKQFSIVSYDIESPASEEGIVRYLSSLKIPGFGLEMAKRIVDRFGLKTLEVLDEDLSALKGIKGLGKKRLKAIGEHWESQSHVREILVFLQSHGLSATFAARIHKALGPKSITLVRENPYILCQEVLGIGFIKADAIAQSLGLAKDSHERLAAGLDYILQEASNNGHSCLPYDLLIQKASALLEATPDHTIFSLQKQLANETFREKTLISDGVSMRHIYLFGLYICECGLAKELRRLQSHQSRLRSVDVKKAGSWVKEKLHFEPAPAQIEAIEKALQEKILIISGGPGTGKSTITKSILAISSHLTSRIVLAAPTGRAAKRLSEVCQYSAKTIHSLLEYDFKTKQFRRDRDNPLECDLLIIDEASMVDVRLAYYLLRAVPNACRVLFIGDADQLPSVGPGKVLEDLIASQMLPTVMLSQIFRQQKGSAIPENAQRIKNGLFPLVEKEGDFFFIEQETPQALLSKLLSLVCGRLTERYAFDPFNDIQVLSPMKKGPLGSIEINRRLQGALNPNQKSLTYGEVVFCEHDKVMQLRNNYEKNCFNGDIGRVEHIDSGGKKLYVRFDEELVEYTRSELNELSLAYCVSVHKYQGSECPCVIVLMHTAHFKLLQRKLLYTAVTRGKKLVVLLGSLRAITLALSKTDGLFRYSGLRQILIENGQNR